jgi:hypothetical protein
MSKEQKDLEIKADELGKELSDDEVEAATGGDDCVCLLAGYGNSSIYTDKYKTIKHKSAVLSR